MKMRPRGQYQFLALLITAFGIIIFAAIQPAVAAVINPTINGLDNDITKALLQFALPAMLLGILASFFFLSSPSGR